MERGSKLRDGEKNDLGSFCVDANGEASLHKGRIHLAVCGFHCFSSPRKASGDPEGGILNARPLYVFCGSESKSEQRRLPAKLYSVT